MAAPLSQISQGLGLLQQPPFSTLAVLLLSAALSFATNLANRMATNMEEFRRMTIGSHIARKEMMEAMRSGNQRLVAKAKKQQQEQAKAQQKMAMGRMKVMLLFFVPFILIWQLIVGFFQGVVAYMPIALPWIGSQLPVTSWYIFTSVSTNIIASRVLGLTFEIEPA